MDKEINTVCLSTEEIWFQQLFINFCPPSSSYVLQVSNPISTILCLLHLRVSHLCNQPVPDLLPPSLHQSTLILVEIKNLTMGLSNWKAGPASNFFSAPFGVSVSRSFFSATRSSGEILNQRLGCLKLLDLAEALLLSPIDGSWLRQRVSGAVVIRWRRVVTRWCARREQQVNPGQC